MQGMCFWWILIHNTLCTILEYFILFMQVKCCLYGNVDLRSSGSFVLYNYARIATIMDKFEDAIRKGETITITLMHHVIY